MKRWGYWILAVLAVSALSGRSAAGTDVAKLRPVEVVSITCVEGQIQVRTDTGDGGIGENLKAAIQNLQDTTPAEVFLDTAEYLLIDADCKELMEELMGYLRPSCGVCMVEGNPELEKVAAYLKIHQPTATLRKFKAGMTELQTLKVAEGRMELVS